MSGMNIKTLKKSSGRGPAPLIQAESQVGWVPWEARSYESQIEASNRNWKWEPDATSRAIGRPVSGIRLRSPHPHQICGLLRDGIVNCLAAAFSSGVWAPTPMPIGDASDPHSAHGILAELGERVQVIVASKTTADPIHEYKEVLGCVVGAVLDESLIDAYGLAPYGACIGDGLLAYIGVAPSAQGSRALQRRVNEFDLRPGQASAPINQKGDSLASLLFARWLDLSEIEQCPRVFVRTRKVLDPILHLAGKNGFQYLGQFELDFQGERQDRMVFGRSNS